MCHCHRFIRLTQQQQSCQQTNRCAVTCTLVQLVGDIDPSQFDVFHEMIGTEELSRVGSGGLAWGLFGGLSIGLPPILHFGSNELKDRIAAPCLRGDKIICLAVTEPSAGSDVANLKCTAVKSADGKHYSQ